ASVQGSAGRIEAHRAQVTDQTNHDELRVGKRVGPRIAVPGGAPAHLHTESPLYRARHPFRYCVRVVEPALATGDSQAERQRTAYRPLPFHLLRAPLQLGKGSCPELGCSHQHSRRGSKVQIQSAEQLRVALHGDYPALLHLCAGAELPDLAQGDRLDPGSNNDAEVQLSATLLTGHLSAVLAGDCSSRWRTRGWGICLTAVRALPAGFGGTSITDRNGPHEQRYTVPCEGGAIDRIDP